jgi:thiol-disulfide isomerase/thioredoxin
MKKFLITVVVFFGALQAFRECRPGPRFNNAAGALQVERLGSDGTVVREEFQPRLAPYLAVYHGASWCPPCQRFSPELAKFYHDSDKTKHLFQLIMANYDETHADMIAYMRQHRMEFPAISQKDAGAWGAATGPGIPNLVIIDTATGKVVSSSYDGSIYQGCEVPLAVLKAIIANGHP